MSAATLLAIAPTLVHPIPFFFVLERRAWWQWCRIGIGVVLYRLLAATHALGPHHPLTRAALVASRTAAGQDAPLIGGAVYQDARCDDIGLVWANDCRCSASWGSDRGGDARPPSSVGAQGIVATLPSGERVAARTLVIAAGPWTDAVRASIGLPERGLVGGTKGIHVTFPTARLPLTQALALRHPDDQRVMFCIPEPEHASRAWSGPPTPRPPNRPTR